MSIKDFLVGKERVSNDKDLCKFQIAVHNKILALRAIEAVITSDRFQDLWKVSDEKQKEQVLSLDCKDDIVDWIEQHPLLDLGDMPIGKLKILAAAYKIRGYNRMKVATLVTRIKEKRNVKNENRNA